MTSHSPAAKKGQRSLPWTFEGIISFSDFSRQDFHLNMVMMEEGAGAEPSPAGARPKKKSRKTYDLTAADRFWQKHKGSPFPEVAESVQEELDTYRAQEDEVKRLKSIMGLEGEDEGAISMSDNRAKLTSAVSSLPELLEKKRLIDLHTNVATAVLDHIKSRKLDVYFEYEEKLMSKATLDKSLLDIISDPDAGTPEDKMRLFLIYYISAQQAPSEVCWSGPRWIQFRTPSGDDQIICSQAEFIPWFHFIFHICKKKKST
ncbi:sec1 family domain-containing protein 1-like [Scophthalmus maximus]|uniref:sec1 family domain-containing protein 1-like n=1 Tax=Scophthalmus maximus TaxID=52904 RepID=UPI001FA85CD5|nr:sec1 family domain-containing protein 1-like [Scophthalmus maximus]